MSAQVHTSRADRQRVRVLATAAEIFSRRGFRATSMNEIAAAVGLSKPTLYHYFRSKEELLVRLYSDVLDESLALALEVVDSEPTPLEAVRELIRSRVVYTCRRQALLKVCFEEEHEIPADLADGLLRRRRAFEDLFSAALDAHLRAYPAIEIGMPPKVWVNMCLGAANWTYKWFRESGDCTPEQLGDRIAASLTAGITPA
ncbi:TetR/AcrR family transcriptional regulator [Pseudonocardia sp. KRD291]|uniref:TetR/AcrR family transcriptional regulator n=1 Tax=Pseudonocardia sp. KRD291 TaxID=2792007 RepID=UPI001C49CE58|nr:TetR/AcrR family transcriptional regulator [Pseudonocardia sp. KRD291]MBW0105006.1 TetR family transcriptional regulator [Pseudonocardia sp. KRD291]